MKKRNLLFICLIAISCNLLAVNTFQYKQILPRSQFMNYSPDRPHSAVLMDDEGNIFIVSQAFSTECLVMQKIDPYGNPLLADPKIGLPLIDGDTGADANYFPAMASDGNGGVFITYGYGTFVVYDGCWDYDFDTYLQHLNADGEKKWPDKGLLVCSESGPWDMAADGNSGVYIMYSGASDCDYHDSKYIQHIDNQGNMQYEGYGLSILECDEHQLNRLYPDDNHGIYISNRGTFLQNINDTGEFNFPMPYLATGLPFLQRQWIFKTGEGIFIIGNNGFGYSKFIRAQKIDFKNELLWGNHGISYQFPDSVYLSPIVTKKDENSYYLFTQNFMNCIDSNGNIGFQNSQKIFKNDSLEYGLVYAEHSQTFGSFTLYAAQKWITNSYNKGIVKLQKIDENGCLPWGINGITVCDTSEFLSLTHSIFTINEQTGTAQVFLEFHYGLYVAIVDLKTGTLIEESKEYSIKTPDDITIKSYPNPFNDFIQFKIKKQNPSDKIHSVKLFNILGEGVQDLTQIAKSKEIFSWDGTDYSGQRTAAGIYFVQIKSNKVVTHKILKLN